jgi:multidrug resistance efflux pump
MLKMAEKFYNRSYEAKFNKIILLIFLSILASAAVIPLILANMPVNEIVYTDGEVVPVDEIDLYAIHTATVERVFVDDNERVETGEIIVTLRHDEMTEKAAMLRYELNILDAENPPEVLKKQARIVSQRYREKRESLVERIQLLEKNMEQHIVKAPIGGTVINLEVRDGESRNYEAGDRICTIVGREHMVIKTVLDSRYSHKIAKGLPVIIKKQSIKRTGVIKNVTLKESEDETYLYGVEILVGSGEKELNPGDIVQLKIITERKRIKEILKDRINLFTPVIVDDISTDSASL